MGAKKVTKKVARHFFWHRVVALMFDIGVTLWSHISDFHCQSTYKNDQITPSHVASNTVSCTLIMASNVEVQPGCS